MIEIKKTIEQGFASGGLYDILKQLQNAAFLTQGKVFYVFKGGNNTTGESWETAFNTIQAAVDAHVAYRATQTNKSVNTYIIIAPATYDEIITTNLFSCTMIGLGIPGTDKATEWNTTDGACIAATASGLRLVNIRFEAGGDHDCLEFNICNNVEILNCDFQCKDDDNDAAISTQNSSYLTVRDCKIGTGTDYLFDYGIYAAVGGDSIFFHNAIIENNIIEVGGTGTGIYIAAGCTSTDTIIRNNIIKTGGAGTGIEDLAGDNWAVVIGNYIFTQTGTWADVNTDLAANNYHNDAGGSVEEEPYKIS